MGNGGITKRRARVVVNQLAPGAGRQDWAHALAGELDGYELSEVRVTGFAGARDAALTAADDGVDLVVAVGGDGTINACANGIGDRATRLAVMPAGTANDLARILGQNRDPARSVAEIGGWTRREMDALSVCGTRYYSAGGTGFVAEVADRANQWRSRGPLLRWLMRRLGSFIYTLACMVVLATRRKLVDRYTVRYLRPDGREDELEFEGYGLLASNCDQLGASFHLDPSAAVDDGVFELVVFPAMSRLALLGAVLAARRGKLFTIPGIRSLRALSATVTCQAEAGFFGDGEILERGTRFEVGLEPASFRLLAPVVAEARPALAPAHRRAA